MPETPTKQIKKQLRMGRTYRRAQLRFAETRNPGDGLDTERGDDPLPRFALQPRNGADPLRVQER
eukprot:CAMPEP_0177776816 /NCGR_PEP_ID=MMETSP0491_2-20121128/14928_1 /TAXON_ID=63592 /ORGANISM="Tetraselmis chuii, Strain PLY429" /LENGTH=64 /DNA_ID=CAMNT_0019295659 /DNA_START=475 /DNA_END=669 /DNA_ORIENTATION=-